MVKKNKCNFAAQGRRIVDLICNVQRGDRIGRFDLGTAKLVYYFPWPERQCFDFSSICSQGSSGSQQSLHDGQFVADKDALTVPQIEGRGISLRCSSISTARQQ